VPTTSLVQGTVTFLGTGFAMIMVKTFGRSHATGIRNGYNDDLKTDMFISSVKKLFLSSFTLLTVLEKQFSF